MCGITGIIGPECARPDIEPTIRRMTTLMAHRGPDDEGFFFSPEAALGFRRLSVIDLATGRQPIFNEDGSIAVVHNGEIYNYRDLRDELAARGHVFVTQSDAETIVHAYEEFGDRCVERLHGMFAFCVWDSKRRRAFLARDRLGKKPLYYARSGPNLVFASEMKAIFASELVRPGIAFDGLSDYLTYRFYPSPETPCPGVEKLPPAHTLVFENGEAVAKRYWRVRELAKRSGSRKAIGEEIVERLRRAVQRRLVSDVPLGLFLSGGVDSSVILAIMADLMKEPVKTFTIGFDMGPRYEEFEYAEEVARLFGADHRATRITATDFLGALPRIIWHLDEPVADSATVPMYFIAKLAKQKITVALCGEGSDELFAGYARLFMYDFKRHRAKRLLRMLPEFTRGPAVQRLIHAYLPSYAGKIEFLSRPIEEDAVTSMGDYFTAEEKRDLLTEAAFRAAGGKDAYRFLREYLAAYPGSRYLDKKLLVDLAYWLPDNLLIKADRATMAHGVELRVPFLDHEFVEYAFTLRDELKIHRGQGKYVLKKAFEGILPRHLLYRTKMGFPVPLAEWFRGVLRENLREILLGERAARRGIFNPEAVKGVIDRHVREEKNLAGHLWILLVFELWCRIFIDGEPYETMQLL